MRTLSPRRAQIRMARALRHSKSIFARRSREPGPPLVTGALDGNTSFRFGLGLGDDAPIRTVALSTE